MSEDKSLNKKIIKLMRLTSQEQMILTYMERFYLEKKNASRLIKLLNGGISIRLIDYFVTNFSKTNRSNIILCKSKLNSMNSNYAENALHSIDSTENTSVLHSKTDFSDLQSKININSADMNTMHSTNSRVNSKNHKKSIKNINTKTLNIPNESIGYPTQFVELNANDSDRRSQRSHSIDYKIEKNHIESKENPSDSTNSILKKNSQILNIHSSYKSQLKAWNKKYFDPFSRGDRIPFFLNGIVIITTIGQLNFFKWFIQNKIYKFIKENYDDIELGMISSKPKKNKIKNKYNKYQSNIYSNRRLNRSTDYIRKKYSNNIESKDSYDSYRFNEVESNQSFDSKHSNIQIRSSSINAQQCESIAKQSMDSVYSFKNQTKIMVRFD